MKINIKSILLLFSLGFVMSCGGGDDGPPPPPPNSAPTAVSQLIFPTADLLCIDNNITFQWSAATDSDGDPISYLVVIATDRNFNTIVEQRTVSTTSTTIILQKGIAYYWRVTAMDNQGGEAEASSTFAFYTEGEGEPNHAPFTAAINTPENNGTVAAGTINLSWSGGDSDPGDTLTYDLYFGEATDPPLVESGLTTENSDVATTSGITYYWRVDTTDDGGIKTIGQVWSFTTN